MSRHALGSRIGRSRARMWALAGACVLLTCSPGGVAGAASAPDTPGYVPRLATSAELGAATPLEGSGLLVGISKDYPKICKGRTATGLESTGVPATEERTDLGPPVIELDRLQGGTSYVYCLFVDNRSPRDKTFTLTAVEIVGSDDPDTKQSVISPPVSVGTWLHPAATRFEIGSGERFYVPYVIDVPPNPPRGLVAGGLELSEVRAGVATSPGFDISLVHKVFITFPGGEAKPLEYSNVRAPRILSRDKGQTSYTARFDVHNAGTLVDSYTVQLDMHGLLTKVGTAKSSPSLLLPNSSERSVSRVGDMPWIGFFRPTATLDGRDGEVEVELPWVLVLPPRPFVIAFLVALALPILAFVVRWRRRRREWMEYLAEEEEDGHDDHDDHDWEHGGPS